MLFDNYKFLLKEKVVFLKIYFLDYYMFNVISFVIYISSRVKL